MKRRIPGDLVMVATAPHKADSQYFLSLKNKTDAIIEATKSGSAEPVDLTISHLAGNSENTKVIKKASFSGTNFLIRRKKK